VSLDILPLTVYVLDKVCEGFHHQENRLQTSPLLALPLVRLIV
jgi:hypothetical protein